MPIISGFNIALGAIPALLIAWLLHTVDVDRIEAKQAAALASQKTALETSCAEDKAITEKANADLQKDRDAIAAERDRLEQLHPSTCIVVPTPEQAHKVAGKAGCPTAHGTTTSAFRDYAADYRTCQVELKHTYEFIDDTWKKNRQ